MEVQLGSLEAGGRDADDGELPGPERDALPTMALSDWNRRCHRLSLMTATGSAPATRPSSSRNPRPSAIGTSSAEKKFAVTTQAPKSCGTSSGLCDIATSAVSYATALERVVARS